MPVKTKIGLGRAINLSDPSDLDTVQLDQDIHVTARLLVRVETKKANPVRVNIMMPGDLLVAVDRYAVQVVGFAGPGGEAQAAAGERRGSAFIMADRRTLEDLKAAGDGRPAPDGIVSLYHQAFERFGAQALWSRKPSERPTIGQALVVSESLRREGNMTSRAGGADRTGLPCRNRTSRPRYDDWRPSPVRERQEPK